MKRSRCVVVLGFAFLMLLATTARAAGVLVPRDGSPTIRVRSHRVTAVVEDGIARTTVRQTFVNPHGRALEAIYVFPVPEGAALVDLAMETGGQRLEGLLAERRTARRSYDRLVRRRIDPALVEQIGRTKFRLSVFPVLPDQPTVVEITWIERVPLVRGELRYVYPLAEAGETTRTEEDLTVSVTMRSSATIESVSSPVEGMSAALASSHEARASYERNGVPLDRDVVVTAKVASREPSLAVRTFRGAAGDPFFAAVVTPPEVAEDRVLARDVTLVLDTSGSMEGEKIAQAKASARYLLGRLRARDRVNVLLFSDVVHRFAAAPVVASPENLARLRDYVDTARAQGGTALGDALRAATDAPADAGRVSMVVLLTDGLPTVGITAPEEIVAFAKAGAERGLRVFPFGVGADVNGAMLEAVALGGRGAAEVFRPQGEVESRMTAFLTRTESPVLSNLRLEIDGRPADDVLPRPLPDVFLGEQATIAGRAALAGPHEFVVRAVLDGREVELRSRIEVSTRPGGAAAVRDLYARSRLEFLERAHRLRLGLADDAYFAAVDEGAYSTADELVRAMIDLSLETGVQCPYTAFLALIPEDKARLDPRDAEELERAAERGRAKRREIAELGKLVPEEETVRDVRVRPPLELKDANEPPPAMEESSPSEESERVVEDPVLLDAKPADLPADHAELDWDESLGDPRFNSDSPFEGPGTNRTIGIGGGAGGSFGGRYGGSRGLRAGGGGKKVQTACELADVWLAKVAAADGGWPADVGPEGTLLSSAGDPATTGLVLLAFLGAGETHQSGTHKDVVRAGLKFLKARQDSEGCLAPGPSPDRLRDHVIASLALTETYGLTQSVLFRDSARRALGFVTANLLPQKARTRDDVETTAWTVLLLGSARAADLDVDLAVHARLGVRLDLADDAKLGAGDLALLRVARVLAKSLLETTDPRGAGAEFAHVAALLDADPEGLLGTEPLRTLGTLAAFQVGGDAWKRWSEAVAKPHLEQDVRDEGSPLRGSWPPLADGFASGRVRATALANLTVAVYYRYGRIVGMR